MAITYKLRAGYATAGTIAYGVHGTSFDVNAALTAGGGQFVVTDQQLAEALDRYVAVFRFSDDGQALISPIDTIYRSLSVGYQAGDTTSTFEMRRIGEAHPRVRIVGDGTLVFGSGSVAPDTNLYRSSANILRSDDAFQSISTITADVGFSGQVRIGDIGPGSEPGVLFGNSGDAAFYRQAAREFRSNAAVSVQRAAATDYAYRATKDSGDADYRWRVRVDGLTEWGPGSGAPDTSMSRAGVNFLQTAGGFQSYGGTVDQIVLTRLVAGKPFLRFSNTGVDQFDMAGMWLEDAGTIRSNTFFSFESGIIAPIYSFGYAVNPETPTLSAATGIVFLGTGGLAVEGNFGVNGTFPIAKPTVTGSRGGNAALASLLTALANYGLITNSTTA